MKKFEVTISRAATETFTVEAKSRKEAKEIASKEAMNYDWASSNNVLYEIEDTEEV